jgi:hypothetical protein
VSTALQVISIGESAVADEGAGDAGEGLLPALAAQPPRATSAQTVARLRKTGLSPHG